MASFLGLEYLFALFSGILGCITNFSLSHPVLFFLLILVLYKTIQHLVSLPRINNLNDKYVLVTGSARGLGFDIARHLDSLGCHVFAGVRSERGTEELKRGTSDKFQIIKIDVSNPDSVRQAYQEIKSKLPPGTGLWGLVNNAGWAGQRNGPIDWLTIDDYKETMDVNLYGTIDVTITFLPLIKRARGRIVNLSSTMAMIVTPFAVNYAVSKFGVEGFTDGLRRSLRPYGCKAILLRPGMFKTDLVSEENVNAVVTGAWNAQSQEIRDSYGEDFVAKYIKALNKSKEFDVGNKISMVSDAVEVALFSRYPRARYPVGKDVKYAYGPLSALPEWLSDWILEKISGFPIPLDAQRC